MCTFVSSSRLNQNSVHSSLQPGFTLIEILIVVVIIGILASIVIPRFASADEQSRISAMASVTRNVRTMVDYHANSGEFPLAASGFPNAIDGAWWAGGNLPHHMWTQQPIVINTVDGPAEQRYPATKTFDPSNDAAVNTWYNRTNGAFATLVPSQGDNAETLALFNEVNSSALTGLAETE